MQVYFIPPELEEKIAQSTFHVLPTFPSGPVMQCLRKYYRHPDMPYKLLLSIIIESLDSMKINPMTRDMTPEEIKGYYECYYDLMQIFYDLQLIPEDTPREKMNNNIYRILNTITMETYFSLYNAQHNSSSQDYLNGYSDAVNDLFNTIRLLTAETEAQENNMINTERNL